MFLQSLGQFLTAAWQIEITPQPSITSAFLQAPGQLTTALWPGKVGRVQLQGVSWLARLADHELTPLLPGAIVNVIGRDGLTLKVSPRVPSVVCPQQEVSSAGLSPDPEQANIQIIPFLPGGPDETIFNPSTRL